MDLADIKERLTAVEADSRQAKRSLQQARLDVAAASSAVDDALATRQMLQTIAAEIQAAAHARIAAVVSRCLTAVFDTPYEFDILFVSKRGRTEAELSFKRDGYLVDPMTGSGGGVVDVASFALRLAAIILTRPPLRRVLILDECFRFVSKLGNYRERVAALLGALSREMGVQFIMVTHDPALIPGDAVEVGL